MKKIHILFTFLFSLSLFAQSPPIPPGACTNCPPYVDPPFTNQPGRTVIDLNIRYIGTLRLELFDREKPATVKNFLDYVLTGSYSNSFLHRAVTNSIIQGGSLRLVDFGAGGQVIAPVAELASVTNECGTGLYFPNDRVTIALAHYNGETNSGTCHWFINLTNNPAFDAPTTNGFYTVFGRVISGMTNLDKLTPGNTSSAVKTLNMGDWLEELPVRPAATVNTVTYDDLLLVTYSLVYQDLNLSLLTTSLTNQTLSWSSLSNKVHTVAFAPQPGSAWTTLFSTNGTGGIQTFSHSTNLSHGIYRVSYQP